MKPRFDLTAEAHHSSRKVGKFSGTSAQPLAVALALLARLSGDTDEHSGDALRGAAPISERDAEVFNNTSIVTTPSTSEELEGRPTPTP